MTPRTTAPKTDPRAVALSTKTALNYADAKEVVDRYGEHAEKVALALLAMGIYPLSRDPGLTAMLRRAGVLP